MDPITHYTAEDHEFGGPDPGRPKPGVMQVFVKDGIPKMVDFICPCGCGNTCPTPVRPSAEPKKPYRWVYSKGPNGPTLSPSIRWTGGCKAHFNITDGSVQIHGDSGK